MSRLQIQNANIYAHDNGSPEACPSPRSPLSPNQHHQDYHHHQQISPCPQQQDVCRNVVKVHRSAYQYEVCALSRVRAAYSMDSELVTELPCGSVVNVEEIWSNRARISAPICGWLSVYSSCGMQLLMPLDENAAKIGGQIVFKNEQGQIEFAEVTGYDQRCQLHAVMLKRVGLQFVSLNDPHLRYIPKEHTVMPTVQERAVPTSQFPRLQTFVTECMSVDYPSMSPSFHNTTPSVNSDDENEDEKMQPTQPTPGAETALKDSPSRSKRRRRRRKKQRRANKSERAVGARNGGAIEFEE